MNPFRVKLLGYTREEFIQPWMLSRTAPGVRAAAGSLWQTRNPIMDGSCESHLKNNSDH